MKQFFYLTILFAFMSTAAIAQENVIAGNIKATVSGNNLVVTWNESAATGKGSWEVQGSADGRQFSTIGLVWGADPKAANSYAFKQQTNKLSAKYTHFRVLYIASSNEAVASHTIPLTK